MKIKRIFAECLRYSSKWWAKKYVRKFICGWWIERTYQTIERNFKKNWWRKRKIREIKRKRSEFQKKKDDYFIPWKDDPKFKNKVQILKIEKSLEELKEYATENGLINKFKFTEIKHDDVIDFNDESILEFF